MEKTKIRVIACHVSEYYEQLQFPFLTFFHKESFCYFKQLIHLDLGKGFVYVGFPREQLALCSFLSGPWEESEGAQNMVVKITCL